MSLCPRCLTQDEYRFTRGEDYCDNCLAKDEQVGAEALIEEILARLDVLEAKVEKLLTQKTK